MNSLMSCFNLSALYRDGLRYSESMAGVEVCLYMLVYVTEMFNSILSFCYTYKASKLTHYLMLLFPPIVTLPATKNRVKCVHVFRDPNAPLPNPSSNYKISFP